MDFAPRFPDVSLFRESLSKLWLGSKLRESVPSMILFLTYDTRVGTPTSLSSFTCYFSTCTLTLPNWWPLSPKATMAYKIKRDLIDLRNVSSRGRAQPVSCSSLQKWVQSENKDPLQFTAIETITSRPAWKTDIHAGSIATSRKCFAAPFILPFRRRQW